MSRVAVVTGARRAWGSAISQRFAEQGHRSRCSTSTATPPSEAADGAAVERRARRSARRSTSATAPRSTPRSTQVRRELGPIEIMVTSAGIDRFERFTDITPESLGPHARGQPHRHVPLPAGARSPTCSTRAGAAS